MTGLLNPIEVASLFRRGHAVRQKKKPTLSDTVWVFEEEEGREEGLRQLYDEKTKGSMKRLAKVENNFF